MLLFSIVLKFFHIENLNYLKNTHNISSAEAWYCDKIEPINENTMGNRAPPPSMGKKNFKVFYTASNIYELVAQSFKKQDRRYTAAVLYYD